MGSPPGLSMGAAWQAPPPLPSSSPLRQILPPLPSLPLPSSAPLRSSSGAQTLPPLPPSSPLPSLSPLPPLLTFSPAAPPPSPATAACAGPLLRMGTSITKPMAATHPHAPALALMHSSGRRWVVSASAASPGSVSASAATAPPAATTKTTPFAHVRSRQELLGVIKAAGLPPKMAQGMEEFYHSYEEAIKSSNAPNPEAVSVRVMGMVFDRIAMQLLEPFSFPSHHTGIRGPYDYYKFGQDYVGPLIDFNHSYVGNPEIFDQMVEQLKQGHNIVLLANHQTEADPAVLAHMLDHRHPSLATALTYVAGDRVVLDIMCKPFSMGRNLLCVHSKKHVHDIPELAEKKLAENRRTLKEMAKLFKRGGNLIWVAPSGGRDRPDPATDEWVPAAFDPSAVELMRRLAEDGGQPYHLHPLAIYCYKIMPPPRKLEKELGEKRVIGHSGVGISVAPHLDFARLTQGIQDKKQARDVFSAHAYKSVVEHYNVLVHAIQHGAGLEASSEASSLSKPWKQC